MSSQNTLSKQCTHKVEEEWLCDHCKKAKFSSFKEACDHETLCLERLNEEKARELASHDTSSRPKKTNHPFFVSNNKRSKKGPSTSSGTVVNIDDSQSNGTNTESSFNNSSKRDTAKSGFAVDSTNAPPVAKKRKPTKPSGTNTVPPIMKKLAERAAKKPSNNNKALASIFGSKVNKETMAEQRMAEFGAQRRLAVERDRLKNEKKREEFEVQQPKKGKAQPLTVRQRMSFSEQFPKESHVGVFLQEEMDATSGKYASAVQSLVKTTRHPHGEQLPVVEEGAISLPPSSPLFKDNDPVRQVLSSILLPSPKVHPDSDARLWTDKYDFQSPMNMCGAENLKAAQKLIQFVEDWKIRRQEAYDRRVERQRKFAKKKKKKTNKRKKHDSGDDDFMDEEGELETIYILTGPCGSGKSSLVKAAAKHCGCKVLELNTTSKRGGQALKNTIEEATKSDSTFDLLNTKGATTSFFQQKRNELHDTDEESADEEREGRAVPIILIDEVDILFEEQGDSGFWNALKSVTKNSLSPIILTANSLPLILAQSMRFRHSELQRPRPQECGGKLWQIVKSEGMQKRESVGRVEIDEALHTFAEVCHCDVRRMITELQLFSLCSDCGKEEKRVILKQPVQATTASDHSPTVEQIVPIVVPFDQHTLLTISGANFSCLRNPMVRVGNQPCQMAQVANDNTMYAICPPCPNSNNLSARYPLLSIHSEGLPAFGLNRGTVIHCDDLGDGSKMTTMSHLTIDYRFPQIFDSDDESIQEPGVPNVSRTVEDSKEGSSDNSEKEAVRLLMEKVKHGESVANTTKESPTISKCFPNSHTATCNEIELIADRWSQESDWVEIECGISCRSLPYLAGAALGLGNEPITGTVGPHALSWGTKRPPSFEKIFENSLNDSGGFFGNSDSYMTSPAVRDRVLLSYQAFSGKYCIQEPSLPPTPEDEESIDPCDKMFECCSDEDAFLLHPTFQSCDYANDLRHLASHSDASTINVYNLSAQITRKRNEMRRAMRSLLSRTANPTVSSLALVRFPVAAACSSPNDHLYLEVAPIITIIALLEKAAIAVFETCTEKHDTTRRSTRRTRRSRRPHYFRNFNQALDDEEAMAMGEHLIEGRLTLMC